MSLQSVAGWEPPDTRTDTLAISAFTDVPGLCSWFFIGIKKHLALFLFCLAELIQLDGTCGLRWWLRMDPHLHLPVGERVVHT